jgi:transcriptional regulatory protein LevR
MRDTEVTDEQQCRLKGTLNEALEYKLKAHANHVVKYVRKRHKVESAQLEFIIDDKGMLYLIDFSGLQMSNFRVFSWRFQKD